MFVIESNFKMFYCLRVSRDIKSKILLGIKKKCIRLVINIEIDQLRVGINDQNEVHDSGIYSCL